MRLTLRTLLAYLDDTLSPSEVKKIGQKVAESDAAQELVARIKQVTRRRRLTTPSNGGKEEPFDPNRVAEYLESELAREEVTEIEKICLDSDVHLAEVAACHQILTLVEADLERPMLIPPAAKQRMYDLIHGRRQPRAVKPVPASTRARTSSHREMEEVTDETLLLGLPLFRQAPWLRWALPATAAVLLVTFGVIVWTVLSGSPSNNPPPSRVVRTSTPEAPEKKNKGDDDDKKGGGNDGGGTKTGGNDGGGTKTGGNDGGGTKTGGNDGGGTKTGGNDGGGTKTGGNDGGGTKTGGNDGGGTKTGGNDKPMGADALLAKMYDNEVPEKPSNEQKDAGTLTTPKEVLLRLPEEGAPWGLVDAKKPVQSGKKLMSFPGFHNAVRLEGGLELTLWGNVREFFPSPRLLESIATIQDNPAFHLEVTLDRGRILVRSDANEKRKFRLRFAIPGSDRDEVWDIILRKPGTEIGIERVSFYQPESNALQQDTPQTYVSIYVLSGEIDMQTGEEILGRIRQGYYRLWDNRTSVLSPPQQDRANLGKEHWSRNPYNKDLAKKLIPALESVQLKLTNKGLDLAIAESLNAADPLQRLLAIRATGALGDVRSLLEIMDKEDEQDAARGPERAEAIFVLRHWLARSKGQFDKLFNEKASSGILVENKKYTHFDARTILFLLRPFTVEQYRQPETYQLLIRYLGDDHLIIRELAYSQLRSLVPNEKTGYYPGGTKEARELGQEKWKKLIPPGRLPPAPKLEGKP